MHDVIVVGGGPAGLVTALNLVRAGLDVVVCEKRPGVIDKACGEGLMPGALAALQRLGVDPPGYEVHGITYLDHRREAHARFRRGPGRGVRRTTLHDALRDAVNDDGVPMLDRRVVNVTQYGDHVVADGLRARYLVAADGLHSPLRRSTGVAEPNGHVRLRWGLRRHFRVAPWTDEVEVHWAARSEAYVTPVDADLVGVAVLSSRRGDFEAQLREFPALAARLAGAERGSDVRGAGPLRQRCTARTVGRVLLVGDAAGYIDALTGEGLAVSFAAAEVLADCLLRRRPDEYDAGWARVSRRSRWLTSGLLWARERPALAGRIVPLAARAPWLFSRTVDQLAR